MTRYYDDPCGVARALNVVGERWALLIVRELLLGPKRFTDLRLGLPGISPNVLSQRLDELTERGIVVSEYIGPPTSSSAYRLTRFGAELEPVLTALGRWGARIAPGSDTELSSDALWLAMRTTVATRPECPTGEYELTAANDTVTARVARTGLSMQRGFANSPRASISGDPASMRAVVFGDRDLKTAVRAGELTVDGDLGAADAFVGVFERPLSSHPGDDI